MAKMQNASADRLADEFVTYLFEKYTDHRHVRRVASWIGLIVLGIEKVAQGWKIPRARQLEFSVGPKLYKARYDHLIAPRGGIEILEVLRTPGHPDGDVLVTISSLTEAEQFYTDAPSLKW